MYMYTRIPHGFLQLKENSNAEETRATEREMFGRI